MIPLDLEGALGFTFNPGKGRSPGHTVSRANAWSSWGHGVGREGICSPCGW